MNFESRNPATGELLGVYREHDKAQTDARANHKIKETRFRELPPSKGIRSFCSKVDNEESPTRILANTLCSGRLWGYANTIPYFRIECCACPNQHPV